MNPEEWLMLKLIYGLDKQRKSTYEEAAEFLGRPFQEVRQIELAARIHLSELLKGPQEIVLRLRYAIDYTTAMTLEEVGARLNLTRERIRQIEEKAKKRLRHQAHKRHLSDYLN